MASATTHTVNIRPDLPVTLTEAGSGRPALVLHGGGGPFTVAGIAEHLAETMRAITPTHPGWNGAPRPDWLTGIADIALAYLRLPRGKRPARRSGRRFVAWWLDRRRDGYRR